MTTGEGAGTTVRVLLVDDHPVVRAGLRALLATHEDLEVTAEAASGEEAVQLAAAVKPDVVLMDLRLGPGIDGARATAQITALRPPPRVVVLTTYDTDTDILRAVEAGASGYLLKDTAPHVLTDSVFAAARGETVLDPEVAQRLHRRMQQPRAEPSAREIEVLALVAAGLSNRAIAKELFVSEATVKSHLVRAFTKLGVDNRTAAVATARTRGLID